MAFEVYLCIDGQACDDSNNCGNINNPCLVNEAQEYGINADDPEGCYHTWHQARIAGDVEITLLDPPPLIDGVWYKSRWSFPIVHEPTLIRIDYIRSQGCSPFFATATGYFEIQDVIPPKHECFVVNTTICETLTQASNIMPYYDIITGEGYDLRATNYLEATILLEVEEQLSIGDLLTPSVVFDSSSAKLPSTDEGATLTINGTLETQGIINDSVDGEVVFGDGVYMLSDLEVDGASDFALLSDITGSITAFGADIASLEADSLEVSNLNVYNAVGGDDLFVTGDIRASTFVGGLNLRKACDAVSNRVRGDSNGLSLIFGDDVGACGLGDFCEGSGDCLSGSCVNGRCV
ncbi:MAG: hypothetical protein H8D38_06340 [DPANN group archaeon]|nr:hypothetical protein [DPANN group archaeon]